MKIEKLPSGSYRIRKTYKKKTYTIVLPYKPSDKEIVMLFAEKFQDQSESTSSGTFIHYAKKYVEARSNVISQATIRTYNLKIKQISDHFGALNLYDITSDDVQKEINRFSKDHSPKTSKTLYGFIASVLKAYRPNLQLRITLPMLIRKSEYEPNTEEIKALLKHAKGTRYSIPFQLGVLGLRRGEICALELSDLDGNALTISKDLVYNGSWIVDNKPKTEASYRTIYLPDSLVEEIRTAGTIYDGHPNALNKAIHRYQKALGIQEFKFHCLRSYFASYAHSLGISDQDIMSMGGWATDHVMKSVYRKTLEDSRAKSMLKISSTILS